MTVDGVAQAIFANLDRFFDNNPELLPHRPLFEQCAEKYRTIVKAKKCTCRTPLNQWGTPCFDTLFTVLEPAKKTNHKLVADFLRHITRLPEAHDMTTVGVSISYKNTSHDIFIDTREETNGDL